MFEMTVTKAAAANYFDLFKPSKSEDLGMKPDKDLAVKYVYGVGFLPFSLNGVVLLKSN